MATNKTETLELGVNVNQVLKANKQLERMHRNMVKIVSTVEDLEKANVTYKLQKKGMEKVNKEQMRMTDFVKAYSVVNAKVSRDRQMQIKELRREQKKQFDEVRRDYINQGRLAKRTADFEIKQQKRVARHESRLRKKRHAELKKSIASRERIILASASIIAGALTLVTASLANQMLSAFDLFEQARINLNTLSGSVEKGNKLFQELVDLTLKTPFKLEETLTGAKRLLAMGVASEEVARTLENLGNIAAGVGREKLPALILAYGQVRTATRLTGQELRQFQEAGVPLLDLLARKSIKTASEIKEAMAKGVAPSFRDVQEAIRDATEENGQFADLMVKQSQTIKGEIDKLSDAWTVYLANVATKFEDTTKSLIKSVKGFLDTLDAEETQSQTDTKNREVSALGGILVDEKSLELRVLAFERLLKIAPEVAKATGLTVENMLALNNLSFTQVALFAEQEEKAKNMARLAIVEFQLKLKSSRLDEIRRKQDRIQLGKRFVGTEFPEGASPLFKHIDEGELEAEASRLIREQNSLRAERARLRPTGTEKSSEQRAFEFVATPKRLKKIAEAFRALDGELEQGLITFENLAKAKLKIVNKFIEETGLKQQEVALRFSGVTNTGIFKESDSRTLREGLGQAATQGLASISTTSIDSDSDLKRFIDRHNKQVMIFEEYNRRLKAIRVDERLTQDQIVQEELNKLREVEQSKLGITAESIRKRKLLEEQLGRVQIQMWSSNLEKFAGISSSFASIVGDSSEEAFDASKALNFGAAIMSTAAAAMNALANNPDPISKWIDFGSVIATGVAQVSAIARTKFKGGGNVENSGSTPSIRSNFGADAGASSDTLNRLSAIGDATDLVDTESLANISDSGITSNELLVEIRDQLTHNGNLL